jgi:4-oxalocrotonate tautomerase
VPFVNVKVIEGVFGPEQKQDMVRRLTDAMVEIEGENMRPVTLVVEEVKSGDWGIASNPVTTTRKPWPPVNRSASCPRRPGPAGIRCMT